MKQGGVAAIIVAGIDAGSTAIKLAFYDGKTWGFWQKPAGWAPRSTATELVSEAAREWGIDAGQLGPVCGTGYGRVGIPGLSRTVTEITCHAKGAARLCPDARTVIDVGGQDTKAIRTEEDGRVADFIMNDKCAAGTGRFLQIMAHALEIDLGDMAKMEADPKIAASPINAMCTVFAESEVIGLLNRGQSRASIVAGIYKSIARRIASMAARISPVAPLALTGGLSVHSLLQEELISEFQMPVVVPDHAVYAGAVGAALFAWDDSNKTSYEKGGCIQ